MYEALRTSVLTTAHVIIDDLASKGAFPADALSGMLAATNAHINQKPSPDLKCM